MFPQGEFTVHSGGDEDSRREGVLIFNSHERGAGHISQSLAKTVMIWLSAEKFEYGVPVRF